MAFVLCLIHKEEEKGGKEASEEVVTFTLILFGIIR